MTSFRMHFAYVARRSKINTKKLFKLFPNVIQVLSAQAGVYTQPEGLVHHHICIGQVTADAEVAPSHVGLFSQVACKEQTSANFVLVQEIDKVSTLDTTVFFHYQRKTKP